MPGRVQSSIPALLLALGACTGSTPDEAIEGAAPPVVLVTASDTDRGPVFEVPAIPSGVVTIALVNETGEPHDFQLFTAAEGRRLGALVAELGSSRGPIPDWVDAAGGVGSTKPAGTGRATVDLLAADHWFVCTLEGPRGPHAEDGMAGKLTPGAPSGAALPATSMSVEAFDYGLADNALASDQATLTFSNTGDQIHHLLIAAVQPDATETEILRYLTPGELPGEPPPIDRARSTTVAAIGPGRTLVAEVTFQSGTRYALACLMSDYEVPGPLHVSRGMLEVVRIT